ncbi:MAG: ATP-binding cassette domain-containing protein [Cyclobacteriaceae bacterium]|nr:ATP-binding cassette domain-containing protein [Cyclobacteriaceae bacterium]MDH5248497.1 ATP-binding cassette domain-containing protein [Cyclobacteriaceae bacterium]
MSEEILKALTQLFAIITKQDGGTTEYERQFVLTFFQTELDRDSVKEYLDLYDQFSGYGKEEEGKSKLTSVTDSVKTLGICKKINKTLTQKQKVVVLIKLLELVSTNKNFTPQRMEIINTAASVFNVAQHEYELIESFVISEDTKSLGYADILLLDKGQHNGEGKLNRHLHGHIEGSLIFVRVQSVDMYFTKYLGEETNALNGFPMQSNRVYLFSHGSTIKTQGGDALYYSDLVAHFNEELKTIKLSFNVHIEEFKFPGGAIGLRNISIAEGSGKLVGIMGPSGAGKTTLLNVMAGLVKPTKGQILINGFDINVQKNRLHGVIGYVSQDDLLIEELTVYQNLYYNAKLCFADYNKEQLHNRVEEVLENLGLDQRKHLRVGNPLDITISGGQRKRLNIALELIREPAILFLDEPTSGLSSRDSENVIDLLKELSLKGKLIFVVIHQPSSDIYKMFDKIIVIDAGGYPAYYGPPIEAITYFKKSTHQIDANRSQCETCGNVNPEQIFNIMEAQVVDEYGQPTSKRKVTPPQWYDLYVERFKINRIEDVKEAPPQSLSLPNKIKQTIIFTTRDTLSKLSNKQYLLINLLEAPLLSLILALIIKYKSAPGGKEYMFRFNENYPAFLLMSIIVAMFMGLTVSAEEIIRDRKILRRESFLNLSWNSYLTAKVIILFALSAVQTFSFVLIGNVILEIEWSMLIPSWCILFTTSCFANVLGLNISSAFNSAVTVYIMIPLLLIPQMILSGLLFSFDKLNDTISTKGKVPIIADLMASRWAYEALAVNQFKNNAYEKPYYTFEKIESQADFRSSLLADELDKKRKFISDNLETKSDSIKQIMQKDLGIIQGALQEDFFKKGLQKELAIEWTLDKYTPELNANLEEFFAAYKKFYQNAYNAAIAARESSIAKNEQGGLYSLNDLKNRYYNESLADLVRNVSEKDRLIEYKGRLVQQVNPIFLDPEPAGLFDYRAHFFAPQKNLVGFTVSTFLFNSLVIWIMTALLYIVLYLELLRKLITSFAVLAGRINLTKARFSKEISIK